MIGSGRDRRPLASGAPHHNPALPELRGSLVRRAGHGTRSCRCRRLGAGATMLLRRVARNGNGGRPDPPSGGMMLFQKRGRSFKLPPSSLSHDLARVDQTPIAKTSVIPTASTKMRKAQPLPPDSPLFTARSMSHDRSARIARRPRRIRSNHLDVGLAASARRNARGRRYKRCRPAACALLMKRQLFGRRKVHHLRCFVLVVEVVGGRCRKRIRMSDGCRAFGVVSAVRAHDTSRNCNRCSERGLR